MRSKSGNPAVKYLTAILVLGGVIGVALSMPGSAHASEDKTAKQREATETIVREYLLKNPEIIREALIVLQQREELAKRQAAAAALKDREDELLHDPDSPIGGNPKGDITIVEFFDYNCGYCKRVAPTVDALIKNDPNIRVVYKEYAILGPPSVLAAKAALAARRQGKYHEFHDALMKGGRAGQSSVQKIAARLGIDHDRLKKDMEDPALDAMIRKNYRLADALGIAGTPAFVIGDQVVPGAIGPDQFAAIIREQRARRKSGGPGE